MRNYIYIFIFIIFYAHTSFSSGNGYDSSYLSHVQNAISYAQGKSYNYALSEAEKTNDPVVKDIVLWFKYQNGASDEDFNTVIKFILAHRDWPRTNQIRLSAEYSLNDKIPSTSLIKYFTNREPKTPWAKQLLARAKISQGINDSNVKNLIREAWLESDFSSESELKFMQKYKSFLTRKDYIDRIDKLLWDHKVREAMRLFNLIDQDNRLAFEARILIAKKSHLASKALKKVPSSTLNQPGLLYERALYNIERKNYNGAFNLIKISPIKNSYKQEKWWDIKNQLIRQFIDEKRFKDAYYLAKNSGNLAGTSDYADSEWLAGWICLEFLNDPKDAYKHFYNMFSNVKYPISLSRAAYWAARAAASNGNHDIATKWYKISANYPTNFYGQLSYEKLYPNSKPNLPSYPIPTNSDLQEFKQRSVTRAIKLFIDTKNYNLAELFIKSAIEQTSSLGQLALISEIGLNSKRKSLAVIAAKEANRYGYILTKTGYPVIANMPHSKAGKALVLSIARQESNFDQTARSSANAVGFMQILPSTAHRVARNLGIHYSTNKLIYDPEFNFLIGSEYINSLYSSMDHSYLLAVAAYNAGPGNVRKWINKYGSPRNLNNIEQVINWIEMLPFFETRNYIQRVLENKQIYQYLLEDSHFTLEKDLLM